MLPFALIAGLFTGQAMLYNRGSNNDYSLRFTSHAFLKLLRFTRPKFCSCPIVGVLLIPLAWFVKDKRVRLGLATIALLMGPMWFLPGRMFACIYYVRSSALLSRWRF